MNMANPKAAPPRPSNNPKGPSCQKWNTKASVTPDTEIQLGIRRQYRSMQPATTTISTSAANLKPARLLEAALEGVIGSVCAPLVDEAKATGATILSNKKATLSE